MALSAVQIGNMALSHVGSRSSIESLTENSVEARKINDWYEYSRKQALELFDWNFARRRRALAVHPDAPPEGIWLFRYSYPADCLAARKIENPLGPDADAIPFEIEADDDGDSRSILTNQEDARLIYTFDQKDPNMYSPFFVDLLSFLLAAKIAYALTGKRSIAQDMAQAAAEMVRVAPVYNANEQVGRKPRNADWIRARDAGVNFGDLDTGLSISDITGATGS